MLAFSKRLSNTYCPLHPCLGSGDTAVTKTDPAPTNQGRRQAGHPCPMTRSMTGMIGQLRGTEGPAWEIREGSQGQTKLRGEG